MKVEDKQYQTVSSIFYFVNYFHEEFFPKWIVHYPLKFVPFWEGSFGRYGIFRISLKFAFLSSLLNYLDVAVNSNLELDDRLWVLGFIQSDSGQVRTTQFDIPRSLSKACSEGSRSEKFLFDETISHFVQKGYEMSGSLLSRKFNTPWTQETESNR